MRNKLIILIIMISSLCLYTQDYPKHSTGIDFGTTLFSTVTLPLISDTVFKPKEGAAGKVLDCLFTNSSFGSFYRCLWF